MKTEARAVKIISIDRVIQDIVVGMLQRIGIRDLSSYVFGFVSKAGADQDGFLEIITNPARPADGVIGIKAIAPKTMWRIQTRRGVLLEYQSGEKPDYNAILSDIRGEDGPISSAIRLAPDQIIHLCPANYGVGRGNSPVTEVFSERHVIAGIQELIKRHLRLLNISDKSVYLVLVTENPIHASEMQRGSQYRLDDSGRLRVVEMSHVTRDGMVIVHERGEAGVQNMFGICQNTTVVFIPDVSNDNRCPGCKGHLNRIPANHPNPVCQAHTHYCECGCGWMGMGELTI